MAIELGSRPWKLWRSHLKNQNTLFGYRLPIALFASIILGAGLGYLAINRFSNWRDWQAFDPNTSFDTAIPVIPWMILPYYTLYFYYPMAAMLGMKNDQTKRECILFHQILLILTWLIWMIFIFLPAKVDLRGSIDYDELGIWSGLFESLHSVDTPWNAWPSLHIVQSLLSVLIVQRWYFGQSNKHNISLVILWFCWSLLAISVMTTKQHFVWDTVTAIIISLAAWKYWFLPILERSNDEEMIAEFEAILSD